MKTLRKNSNAFRDALNSIKTAQVLGGGDCRTITTVESLKAVILAHPWCKLYRQMGQLYAETSSATFLCNAANVAPYGGIRIN